MWDRVNLLVLGRHAHESTECTKTVSVLLNVVKLFGKLAVLNK